jgi:hypothetical protein
MLVVGGIGLKIGADAIEVAVLDEDAIGGREGMVESAEIGGGGDMVLVDGEGITPVLRIGGQRQE